VVGDKISINMRMDVEVLEELRAKGVNVSDYIRDSVTKRLEDEKRESLVETLPLTPMTGKMPDRPILDDVPRVKPERKFELPVGDVICAGTDHEQVRLWWCPPSKTHEVVDIAKFLDGFQLHMGEEGKGSWYMPEVIETEEQERVHNGNFCVSCHMIPAYKDDRMVWLTVNDPAKALKTMDSRTDIPCPVRIDVHKYSEDDTYKEACDKANELFAFWWKFGKPKATKYTKIDDIPIEDRYDV
jgi:hypothetical protein